MVVGIRPNNCFTATAALLSMMMMMIIQQVFTAATAASLAFAAATTAEASSEALVVDDSNNNNIVYRYNICNGLSNQLLYHAASIAIAIERGQPVEIPNHFIVNGVQHTNRDVLPNPTNSIPFDVAFDANSFLEDLHDLGLQKAAFVTFDFSKNSIQIPCAGMQSLQQANPFLMRQIILAFKPSKKLERIVDDITDLLSLRSDNDSDGICVHHRDGKDWHKHCKRWGNIKDGIYRGNCLGVPGRSFVESLEDRGLVSIEAYGDYYGGGDNSNKKWVYYCGDHEIPQKLKDTSDVFSRVQLMDSNAKFAVKSLAGDSIDDPYTSANNIRDLWALIDFYVCRDITTFIGNSVSTFSAIQIAIRQNEKAYWYNTQSVPLADIWQAYTIPIVYTYTELSKSTGKIMLQASIASIKKHMPTSEVHILYHGNTDKVFRKWLIDKGVNLHQHDPGWRDKIEEMRKNGDKLRSNLFLHSGNYFGTWQRIDIPLFVESEYALLLDSDTILLKPFTLADFGLNMTYGIAMSSEMRPNDKTPSNAGVMLMNIPKMRQTYAEFLYFILSHVSNGANFDHPSPSDQGAYLEFYGKLDLVGYLPWKFNFKPYWQSVKLEDSYIVHFHGPKPHDYIKKIMGVKCDKAIHGLCNRAMRLPYLCDSIQHFAMATRSVDRVEYCNKSFSGNKARAIFCNEIMSVLAMQNNRNQCEDFPSLLRRVLLRLPVELDLPRDKIERNIWNGELFILMKKKHSFGAFNMFLLCMLFLAGRWYYLKSKRTKNFLFQQLPAALHEQ